MTNAKQQNVAEQPMKWSWKIAKVAGISIYMHWTFLLLVGWIIMIYFNQSGSWVSALWGVALVLSVFVCVVLHELGHALTAQQFNIQTRDITLLPIGGLARLEKIPEDPKQELLITAAGPAVNVVIAGVLFLILFVLGQFSPLENAFSVSSPFLLQLLVINIILVIFNVLPAFPMDGGRVLRALLAMRMDYVVATQIAARTGQIMAIMFGILGVMSHNWVLLIIAIFVYFGAQMEAHAVQVRFATRNVPVTDAMLTDFVILSEGETLQVAVDALLAGTQHDFPVMENEHLLGILRRQDLIQGLAEHSAETPVEAVMQRDCQTVDATAMLEDVLEQMQTGSCPMLPVFQNEKLVGLLTRENIGEWLMVQAALRQSHPGEHR